MYNNNTTVNSPFSQQPLQQNNTMLQRQMPMGGGAGMNMNQQTITQQPGTVHKMINY